MRKFPTDISCIILSHFLCFLSVSLILTFSGIFCQYFVFLLSFCHIFVFFFFLSLSFILSPFLILSSFLLFSHIFSYSHFLSLSHPSSHSPTFLFLSQIISSCLTSIIYFLLFSHFLLFPGRILTLALLFCIYFQLPFTNINVSYMKETFLFEYKYDFTCTFNDFRSFFVLINNI